MVVSTQGKTIAATAVVAAYKPVIRSSRDASSVHADGEEAALEAVEGMEHRQVVPSEVERRPSGALGASNWMLDGNHTCSFAADEEKNPSGPSPDALRAEAWHDVQEFVEVGCLAGLAAGLRVDLDE